MFIIASAICFSFSMLLFCGIEILKIVMNGEGNYLHEAMPYPVILLIVSIVLFVAEFIINQGLQKFLKRGDTDV